MEKSAATVLDARGFSARGPYVRNACVIRWSKYRDGWFRTGRLSDDHDSIAADLAALGVSHDRPVLVYGDMAEGWGEEGRIWWMLAYLGHPRIYILDGGIAAWRRHGFPTAPTSCAEPVAGHFKASPQPVLRVDAAQVLAASTKRSSSIFDARRKEEYDGTSVPYLSSRRGHIPSAAHLHWKDLIGKGGTVLPKTEVLARLRTAGGDPCKPVIAYCTAGVRSAFEVAVLRHHGIAAANYDGSWWEWASNKKLPIAGAGR